MTSKNVILPRLLCVLFLLTSAQAYGFQAWWQCSSRKGGDWSFGRAPSICLVDHMQTQSAVKSQYAPLLFDDNKSRNGERSRYMTELNALAKEVATYYLRKRKPGVSNSEIQAFTKGLLTLMHQETVWSHYRTSNDLRVRYMRGDSGHGHGLMQVDDRSHQTALLQGRGADLVKNMIYGLDVFYAAWQRAPNQSCVSSPTNWTARIRSAWSAYNGGPARICRWTSNSGTFAHHDKQFLQKLQNQSFKNYVTSESKKTVLDIDCLAEGSRPCPNNGNNGGGGSEPIKPVVGELYKLGSGMYCLAANNDFQCLDRLNDVTCLELRDNRAYPIRGELSDKQIEGIEIKKFDRNRLCQAEVKNLYEISQMIETKKRINIRKTPGGEWLGTLPLDSKTQVLDFEVKDRNQEKRYYKVKHNGLEGYIYAGDKNSSNSWAIKIDDNGDTQIVASVGDTIKVVAPFGINQRKNPNGELIQRIPKDEELVVLDRDVRGSQNYLYYKVQYENQEGFIYSGYLKDEKSVEGWTQVVQPQSQSLALRDDISFRFLRTCPESQCNFSRQFIRSEIASDQLEVLETKGQWSKVRTLNQSKEGWLLSSDLQQVN